MFIVFFFFNDTATTEIYTLSLHDALPICVITHYISYLSSISAFKNLAVNKNNLSYTRDITAYKEQVSFDRKGYVEMLVKLRVDKQERIAQKRIELEEIKLKN